MAQGFQDLQQAVKVLLLAVLPFLPEEPGILRVVREGILIGDEDGDQVVLLWLVILEDCFLHGAQGVRTISPMPALAR